MLYVRCVLFDLDGTLYDSPEYSVRLEGEIVRFVSERLGLGEFETKTLLNKRRKELGTLTRTIQSLGIDRNAFFDAMAERIDPSLYISRDPIVRSVIEALRERGFKVGLVSNSGRPLVKKILSAIGLEDNLFDTIVTSTEAEPKPSPQPFQLATDKASCAPNEIAYVGDREEAEIQPANNFGLRTVLLNRDCTVLNTCADATIRNLREVLDVVRLS
jgi:HAD superfamily hydrolase (TIGR01549 family)